MRLSSLPRPTFILLIIAVVFAIVSLSALLGAPPISNRRISQEQFRESPVQVSQRKSQQVSQPIQEGIYKIQETIHTNRKEGYTSCIPHQKLVFLKTHKTASTTLASIIQRYGYIHNLTFLVPRANHFVNYRKIFNADRINLTEATDVEKGRWNFKRGYDILTNHARYNRTSMDRVFHDARYVTILREPSAQFESAFNYFEIWRSLPRSRTPLELFMEDPATHFRNVMRSKQYYKDSMHNQHLFDLGMRHEEMNDDDKVKRKIAEIEVDFDLVMITEYFDESLILLKKLLCWGIDDILYLAKGTRNPNYHVGVSSELRAKIQAWNEADVALYEHFNRTFWQKVKEYGPDFEKDLAAFRQRLSDTYNACCNKSRSNTNDRRVVLLSLKNNSSDWCRDLARGDVDYTRLIRDRMKQEGIPTYDNRESQKGRKRNG